MTTVGALVAMLPAIDHPDLLAGPVLRALAGLTGGDQVAVAAIDPDLSDTAAFVAAYRVPSELSVNCVLICGRRDGEQRTAAALVPATTRADVNGLVRRALDVRKASFLAMDQAVEQTGMEYGGITAIGLPRGWRLLVDARVPALATVVIGSGVRRSKLMLPGRVLADLPGAEVVEGLGRQVSPVP